MIERLTEEQERMLVEYRDKMFFRAVSTVTNREKAEKWALKLTKGVYDKSPEITWRDGPWEAKMEHDRLWNSFLYEIKLNLKVNLRISLMDRLTHSIKDSLVESLMVSIWDVLWSRFWDPCWDAFRDRAGVSIMGSSTWDTTWDIEWITYHSFMEKAGLVRYDEEDSRKLKCYRKLLKHCFAIYAVRGKIILVDKPTETKVAGGKLVDIEFN